MAETPSAPLSLSPLHGYLLAPDGPWPPPTLLTTEEEVDTFLRESGRYAVRHGLDCLLLSHDETACYLHVQAGRLVHASGMVPPVVLQTHGGR